MPRGQYDREAARARRDEPVTARTEELPHRIRLLEPHGFVDEIGAVYGPKVAGYETTNQREIEVLIERGVRYVAVE